MRKISISFYILTALFMSSCSAPAKKRGVTINSGQEIEVVGESTSLIFRNAAKPTIHQLSSTKITPVVLLKAHESGISCTAELNLPRSQRPSIAIQEHKDLFIFKKKEILEERRTQSVAPFYTNRFKFTYAFQQKNFRSSVERQEIVLVCQTDFAPVQPAMDLTIKDVSDILNKSALEIRKEVGPEDLKDDLFKP